MQFSKKISIPNPVYSEPTVSRSTLEVTCGEKRSFEGKDVEDISKKPKGSNKDEVSLRRFRGFEVEDVNSKKIKGST
ncbi:unnamed protein product [Ilex paraguariensis]|uniref:Uncharacterized protein n=1 Tax=Ilex paraguariensis TaxID=185542 RepID=A0ABC8TNP5_9AQUA